MKGIGFKTFWVGGEGEVGKEEDELGVGAWVWGCAPRK